MLEKRCDYPRGTKSGVRYLLAGKSRRSEVLLYVHYTHHYGQALGITFDSDNSAILDESIYTAQLNRSLANTARTHTDPCDFSPFQVFANRPTSVQVTDYADQPVSASRTIASGEPSCRLTGPYRFLFCTLFAYILHLSQTRLFQLVMKSSWINKTV